MKQLGTLDSAFINLENTTTPQHIGGLGIYDPSTAQGGFVRFKEVLANFEQRLNQLPLFRTRLVTVPGDIDRPYWVEDQHFDVEFHIRHISLPKPGDWRQLFIQAARLHSRSLDMSRPLWEVYIIEGLDNIEGLPEGAFAMYTKMHHSLVDGAGGASFLSALHDLEPNPAPQAKKGSQAILFDRQPSDGELLSRALLNRTVNSVGMMRSIGATAFNLARYGLAVSRDEIPSPDLAAPKTRFNQKVGPHRVADGTAFDLGAIKEIKNATGSTVNDVALALIGGSLRRYLKRHGELPNDSLAASIPLNMRVRRREGDDRNTDNNHVGSMFAELHTNIADPLERIAAVHKSTTEAKIAAEESPMVDALRVAGFFSPAFSKAAAAFWSKNELSRFVPMNTSTVVTNVPGPNFPLYCAGAKMVRYHGLGLLTPGCGLFHTVFSSDGLLTVTILGDRGSMPDPDVYMQCVKASFAEMYEAAVGSKPERPKKKSAAHKTNTGAKTKPKTGTKASTSAKPAPRIQKPANSPTEEMLSSRSASNAASTEIIKENSVAAAKSAASNGVSQANTLRKPARSLRNIKIPASAKRTTTSATKKKKGSAAGIS